MHSFKMIFNFDLFLSIFETLLSKQTSSISTKSSIRIEVKGLFTYKINFKLCETLRLLILLTISGWKSTASASV